MVIDLMKRFEEKKMFESILGFEFGTTFWEEFCISENYGPEGIKEYYGIVFERFKDNLQFLTELVLVLNLKTNSWYMVNDELVETYDALWKKTDDYAMTHLKEDELHYYLSTLD